MSVPLTGPYPDPQVALPSPSTPRPRRPERSNRESRDKRAKKARADLEPVCESEQRCELCLGLFADLPRHVKQVTVRRGTREPATPGRRAGDQARVPTFLYRPPSIYNCSGASQGSIKGCA